MGIDSSLMYEFSHCTSSCTQAVIFATGRSTRSAPNMQELSIPRHNAALSHVSRTRSIVQSGDATVLVNEVIMTIVQVILAASQYDARTPLTQPACSTMFQVSGQPC